MISYHGDQRAVMWHYAAHENGVRRCALCLDIIPWVSFGCGICQRFICEDQACFGGDVRSSATKFPAYTHGIICTECLSDDG